MLRREARARLDEACVALRDRDGEPGRDERALARRELDALARSRGRGRRRRVGARRHHRLRAQPRDRQLDHALSRCVASDDSAIRNGAKRGRSRRGSRAIESDAVGGVLALLDRRAERVELGEPAALLVGQQQPHALPAVVEALARARRLQLLEPLAGHAPRPAARRGSGSRAGGGRAGRPGRSCSARARTAARRRRSRRGRRSTARADGPARRRRADASIDVQHQVGDERLLERRREPLDELVRQAADEADGVGDEVAAAVVLEAARRRVERLEEAGSRPRRPSR